MRKGLAVPQQLEHPGVSSAGFIVHPEALQHRCTEIPHSVPCNFVPCSFEVFTGRTCLFEPACRLQNPTMVAFVLVATSQFCNCSNMYCWQTTVCASSRFIIDFRQLLYWRNQAGGVTAVRVTVAEFCEHIHSGVPPPYGTLYEYADDLCCGCLYGTSTTAEKRHAAPHT